MKLQIVKGSTSQIITVFIQDSSATDGSGLGSLDHTSSIVGGYVRTGGTGVALAVDEDVDTEGTYQAPSAAGKVRIGTPANMTTGTYELHFHNDLFAAGANSVFITLGGASDMAVLPIEIQLTDVNLNDGVRGGMTSLLNVASDGVGGTQKAIFAVGVVWVDDAGTASTAWPYGSAPYPTDTIARGKTIADANGINTIRVAGDHTLVAAMEYYNFVGGLLLDPEKMIDLGGFSVEHSSFRDLVVTGICGNAAAIGDQTAYMDCYLYAVTNIHGWVYNGRVDGACSVRDGGYAIFHNVCFGSAVACTLTIQAPTVCDIENMAGELTLAGMDGGVCSVSMSRGAVLTIDNTCTAGTITVTGAGKVTDNSGVGCTVTIQVAEADIVTIEQADATDTLESASIS